MKYLIGVDVGGTFTDIVCVDRDGNSITKKVPSTPVDPSIAVMNGIRGLADTIGSFFQSQTKCHRVFGRGKLELRLCSYHTC